MKRIGMATNVCVALTALVAATAMVYGAACVVWPPVKADSNYAKVTKVKPPAPPPAKPDVSAVWTALPTILITPPEKFIASLAGTIVSTDPAHSVAVVDHAGAQSIVRVGQRVGPARLASVTPGVANFALGSATLPLTIDRGPQK